MAKLPAERTPAKLPPPTSIRFDVATKRAIEKAAKADARSVTSLVTKVMSDWLKAKGYLK